MRLTLQTDRFGNDECFVQRLEDVLVAQHRNRRLRVADIALALCLSERQLERRVRRATGLTPAQFLKLFRLQRSLGHLVSSQNIGDVAHRVGFASHAYFTSCFRAHFGVTPQEWRKSNGQLRLT
jgi:AraC-like DNA-binding protein